MLCLINLDFTIVLAGIINDIHCMGVECYHGTSSPWVIFCLGIIKAYSNILAVIISFHESIRH